MKLSKPIAVMMFSAVSVVVMSAPPEIANMYPDYPGFGPHIITGENFDPASTEVWCWEPPSRDNGVRGVTVRPGEALPALPAQPPEGARRADVLDIETQVITASLEGAVVWTKNKEGFSRPYLFNVAKPFWVSEEKAKPGDLVYIFGFRLRPEYRRSDLVLKNGTTTLFPRTIVEARSLRTADKRLIYFEIPKDAVPAKYEVFCHNSYGGQWGWQKAGDLEITPQTADSKVFDVRTFGAKGDGLTNDREAITAAIMAARNAGKGVVFLPPGTYLTDETILVPQHIRLRGANRENSVIRGFGDPLKADRVAWFHSLTPPTAVVRLQSDTGLESLTVEGATWKGGGGYGWARRIRIG